MIAIQVTASLLMLIVASTVYARPADYPSDEQISAVIPSPNQDLEDEPTRASKVSNVLSASMNSPVPIYVSPYVRSERGVREVPETGVDASPNYSEEKPISASPRAHEDISYMPAKPTNRDLKSAASYGHGHHEDNHHGGSHGWLDMGAWTGGKGSFGWYADYPVGKKHGGHY